MTISELRGELGAFGFRGDDINKQMRELSGGERARTELIKLMLRKPNLLILDEPTNHLDISSREMLDQALSGYDGTIICVSHDRYLIDKLSSRLLILEQGAFREFDGSYTDYADSLEELRPTAKKQPTKVNDWQLRKQKDAEERRRKTRIAKLEQRIEAIAEEKAALEQALSEPDAAADYERIIRLSETLAALSNEEEALTEEWLSLQQD